MRMDHTTLLSASELKARCVELSVEATGRELSNQRFLDVFGRGLGRPDLAHLLASLIFQGIDGEVELPADDGWEGAFFDAISGVEVGEGITAR